MSIETTISITEKNFALIRLLSNKYRMSKSEIISFVVTLISKKNKSLMKTRFSTEYQEKNSAKFLRMHVYLSEPTFSVSQDLRHFYKSSFSLLIAETIKLYIQDLIDLLEGTDNYHHQIHCQIYCFEGETISFKHYWGMPTLADLEAG